MGKIKSVFNNGTALENKVTDIEHNLNFLSSLVRLVQFWEKKNTCVLTRIGMSMTIGNIK